MAPDATSPFGEVIDVRVVEDSGDSAQPAFTDHFSYGDSLYGPLIETANRLSYTIYPVNTPFDAESSNNIDATLRLIARDTGGRALFRETTLNALEEVVADTRSYYWLGFTPDWKGDDENHRVDVRPRDKGWASQSAPGDEKTHIDVHHAVTYVVARFAGFEHPDARRPQVRNSGGQGKKPMSEDAAAAVYAQLTAIRCVVGKLPAGRLELRLDFGMLFSAAPAPEEMADVDGVVFEVFDIDGKLVLIEKIPARVCSRCGEETFGRETTETVRRLVHGEAEPVRSVSLDVFSYAQTRVA